MCACVSFSLYAKLVYYGRQEVVKQAPDWSLMASMLWSLSLPCVGIGLSGEGHP